MKEALFIKENKEKWEQISKDSKSEISAEDLADNYIELTDDLSYARTFYPGSPTERYLNQLTANYFGSLYKHRKKEKGRFFSFWKYELPEVMYRYRRDMLLSLSIFVIAMLIGAFSMSQDSTYANLILGDAYIDMTLENIDNGDPMAVYKDANKWDMFAFISTNNIKVAFFAFIYGVFFSVGTAVILFQNGVMLGTFQYFFLEKGLLGTSMASVWLHGTLEISAIIIAGGAGFILGNSILFPKTYSRKESITRGSKDALKVVVGLIPVFLVAGFIESYLTRKTEMPLIFNLLIIGLSALFIIYYFAYYPYKLKRKNEI